MAAAAAGKVAERATGCVHLLAHTRARVLLLLLLFLIIIIIIGADAAVWPRGSRRVSIMMILVFSFLFDMKKKKYRKTSFRCSYAACLVGWFY